MTKGIKLGIHLVLSSVGYIYGIHSPPMNSYYCHSCLGVGEDYFQEYTCTTLCVRASGTSPTGTKARISINIEIYFCILGTILGVFLLD